MLSLFKIRRVDGNAIDAEMRSCMDDIKNTLKNLIVKSLKIEDREPGELDDDQPLMDGDLEIDSVDILQLIVDIEREFNIKLVEGKFDREIWKNINSLASAINKIQQKNQ